MLGSQITDKSKKGLGYNTVPPPYPLIYNGPTKLDLSYYGLDEFKDPEFKSYGSKDSKLESNIVCDKKSDDSKENSNDSLVKEQVSEETSSFVESPLNVDKETVFLVDKKIEFVKPKNHEKPVKKSVRSDNGTEFKNKVMDDFCREKGIRREYSVARTLIKAARTMLDDSKLPTTFWAEAVSTACYVQNRVLVVKPHNKTPYDLFRGFKPALTL
ncbi:ribonuclease H-like domain-containing protein [Tanacetum coccineum]